MKTDFTPIQRSNPFFQEMEKNIRKCVHCGFCLSACPTYSILGDERDSPRGRIYLIKDMLEQDGPPSKEIVTHVDRCLSCLACVSACPSGVDYQHYIDNARSYIEDHYKRPWFERSFRTILVSILPYPKFFRIMLGLANLVRPFVGLLEGTFLNIMSITPANLPTVKIPDGPQVFPANGAQVKRIALLTGCAQRVLRPSINEATIRLLTRMGVGVVVTKGIGCCGALNQHLGKVDKARVFAKANIDAWIKEIDQGGLDGIVINAAGCGTEVKDYGFLFKDDPVYSSKAERISRLAKDISEVITELELPLPKIHDLPGIMYHDACSLMHGQGITQQPRDLLKQVGFDVEEVPGPHFCCGSAGSYNLLQPTMANCLKAIRVNGLENGIKASKASIVATGNIGCLIQLESGCSVPIFHTVELLDWATGGPDPQN
jgi:glycolate oxidase iron-sulfur subunit